MGDSLRSEQLVRSSGEDERSMIRSVDGPTIEAGTSSRLKDSSFLGESLFVASVA